MEKFFLKRLAGAAVFLIAASAPGAELETFRTLAQKARAAFREGNFKAAAVLFESIETQFGGEPEFQDAAFQKHFLPACGYALLWAGKPEAAIPRLERFLEHRKGDRNKRLFALTVLSRACRAAGEPDRAIAACRRLAEEFPGTAEAALARLRIGEIMLEQGNWEKGIAHLEAFHAGGACHSLRLQARLRALEAAVKNHARETARRLLLTTKWKIRTMPELAVLAFAALETGDDLLSGGEAADALKAFRLVPPKSRLLQAQTERWQEVQDMTERGNRGGLHPEVWRDYCRELAAKTENLLRGLKETEDYTPGYLLRYGQAYLLAGRNREARIVFETLAKDESAPRDVRAEGWHRWILAAQALERWDEALKLAREFLERHPESPLVPRTIHLMAVSLREKRQYLDAAGLLSSLLERHPRHRRAGHWLFTRAGCYLLAGNYPAGRNDFGDYMNRHPDGMLLINACLWHALSWFFERDYDASRAELDDLIKSVPADHPLRPEILFRRASVFYAKKEYESAIGDLDAFLEKYPEHARAAEGMALRGDVLVGQGRLREASAQYAQIPAADEPWFTRAVFQRGRIFRALGQYDLMIRHFRAYIENGNMPKKKRAGEALRWIGWAYGRLERLEEAFPVILENLANLGNRIEEEDTVLVLETLRHLHLQWLADHEPSGAGHLSLLRHGRFGDWLEEEKKAARATGRLTYYARLVLYQTTELRRQRKNEEAGARLRELAAKIPMEALGAEALGEIGLALIKENPAQAGSYFERLAGAFPGSSRRGAAFYGLALMRAEENEWEDARAWLQRFEAETPCGDLQARALLLHAEVLQRLENPAGAEKKLAELFRLKSARGRLHARALLLAGQIREALGEKEKAAAYYQQIYALYRAYADLAAEAYLAAARLFEDLGDPRAACRALMELYQSSEYMACVPDPGAVLRNIKRLQALPPPGTARPDGAAPESP